MFKLGLNCKILNNLPTWFCENISWNSKHTEKMIAACCLLINVVNDDSESFKLFYLRKTFSDFIIIIIRDLFEFNLGIFPSFKPNR